jgi:phospholipid/cholesterol/gamma-HCH transport system substrate-binding protein
MRMRTALTGAVLAALLGTAGCGFAGMDDLPLPGGPDVGKHPITVTAEFTDVLSLARDATVKYDGVTVGKVSEVGRDGWNARVKLQLRSDLGLPANVTARVAQTSLLGEKYVELTSPSDPQGRLASGADIPLTRTSRGREVEEVLGALSLLLNGGGLSQLHTITAELDTALGDQTATTTFVRQLDTFVATLDRNRATIISTLSNVDRLTGQIARDHRTVEAALDQITPAVRVIAGQRKQLVALLGHLDTFSQVTTGLVRRSGADLVADLQALRPVLSQLELAGNDLPDVLEKVLSFPFPDAVLNAVHGDYVNLDVLVDLSPLTVLGNVVGDDEQLQHLPQTLVPTVPSATPKSGLAGLLDGLLGGLLPGGKP